MKISKMVLAAAAVSAAAVAGADALYEGFVTPPDSAKPHVWWHWMNGNVSRDGIVADLEAMKKAGIGGAQIFDVSDGIPPGPVAFGGEEWKACVRLAASEAKRLGLELAIHNCSGWSSSGGPWITPDRAQKHVVYTETTVKGGTRFAGTLPQPPDPHGFYRDIAVVAVKTPAADLLRMEDFGLVLTATCADKPKKIAALLDGDLAKKACTMHKPKKGGKPNVYTFAFEKPFPAAGLSFAGHVPQRYGDCFVTVTVPGAEEPLVRKHRVCLSILGEHNRAPIYVPFGKRVAAREFKALFEFKNAEPRLEMAEIRLEAGSRTPDLAAKTFDLRYDSYPREVPEPTADQVVAPEDVKVLARGEAAGKSVDWTVPEGDWTLIRFGYACDGKKNRPASYAGEGLEVDKLDADAVEGHYREFRKLIPSSRDGLATLIIDSYETGCPNWTDGFEREFRNRRGYDFTPHLVELTGRIVGDRARTEKALADFRRTLADLFAENYGRKYAELCHRDGYRLEMEGYGSCPSSDLEYGRWADIPMGEFWAAADNGGKSGNVRYAAFLSHVWGRRIAAAESFTSRAETGRWLNDAFSLKAQGDRVYAAGVNRIVYHRYAHQPWANPTRYPGMTMGQHGIHFERTLTWWDQAAEWLKYQGRCQWMLQEGTFVADALCFCGEDAPNCGWSRPIERWHRYDNAKHPVPQGYAFDCCAIDALEAARVEDGAVVVPGGVRYALLGLPDESAMGERSRAAVKRLAEAGATVVASSDLPAALERLGRRCDFTSDREDAHWIHRRYADGGEAYFVAFANETAAEATCTFRVNGKVPELWCPVTGRRWRAHRWSERDGMTTVTFPINPIASVFVVFRPPAAATAPETKAFVTKREIAVDGPWQVAFPAKFVFNKIAKGPDEIMGFPQLVSWTDRAESEIRHFSGSATYAKTFACAVPGTDERVMLDLGEVRNFADVTVNGRTFPTLWKPPFRVDVTDAAKTGRLDVRVKVTNLWPNRLIGDDALPTDCTWKAKGRSGLKEIPAWVNEGKPSPSGRPTFTTWHHWLKDDQPLPSGLLGPVKLMVEE